MKHAFLIFIISILVICAGCKKDAIPSTDEVESPVFYFNGNVNTNPVTIQAGVNDYYMYATFLQDSNGVYQFQGNFKQVNCANCPQLSIFINDDKVSAINAPCEIDTSLVAGIYDYKQIILNNNNTRVKFLPILDSREIPVTYSWDFGDGSTSTSSTPIHTYMSFVSGEFHPSLKMLYQSGCSPQTTRQLLIDSLTSCSAIIKDTALTSTTTQFYALGAISSQATYAWNFGDPFSKTNTSSLKNPTHTFTQPGFYKVSLQIDNDTCIAKTENLFPTLNFVKDCYCNFSFFTAPTVNDLDLSKIIITWVDAKGLKYSSDDTFQPSDSFFKITSIENYSKNEKNQSTKKIHATFKCMCSNGLKTVPVSGEAVFAISYK